MSVATPASGECVSALVAPLKSAFGGSPSAGVASAGTPAPRIAPERIGSGIAAATSIDSPLVDTPAVLATIGLGANLDDPARQLEFAFAELGQLPGTRLVARSPLYASAPVGYLDQPDFVNAVARVSTTLAPRALLDALLDIEHRHGRERSFRNAPRTLDLDLLLYGNANFVEHGLTLPHPRMHERAFVLRPLADLAPDCVIPGAGRVADRLTAVAHQPIHLLEPLTAVVNA